MPTQARLREIFNYDPETGIFTHAVKRKNVIKGGVAGTKHSGGYIKMCVDNYYTFAHRVAWVYMMGELPAGDIDHFNGDRADNRWCNLRHVSRAVNLQNQRKAKGKTSTGILGAYPSGKGYTSRIAVNGKDKYLGVFKTAQEAHNAYLAAKRQLHEGCTI